MAQDRMAESEVRATIFTSVQLNASEGLRNQACRCHAGEVQSNLEASLPLRHGSVRKGQFLPPIDSASCWLVPSASMSVSWEFINLDVEWGTYLLEEMTGGLARLAVGRSKLASH